MPPNYSRKSYTSDNKIDHIEGETRVKYPGSINGNKFLLDNIKSSSIYLLDKIKKIAIKNVANSHMYIGPVKKRCKIDRCDNSSITVCCKKFRLKNCSNIKLYLHCNKIPKFINCYNIVLAPYNFAYPGLPGHVSEQELNVTINLWMEGTIKECMLPSEYRQVEYSENIVGLGEAVNPFLLSTFNQPVYEAVDYAERTPVEIVKLMIDKIIPEKKYQEDDDDKSIPEKKKKY